MWTTLIFIALLLVLIRCIFRITMPRCMSNACLVGKTIILTGGNKGIGYQTALGLAARGCTLIIACRSNAEKEKEEIIRITNNPNVVVKHLDLGSFASVRQFAKEIHESYDKIDVLINNAGIGDSYGLEKTVDGFDPLKQINIYGPFLLTHLLVDLLKEAGHARIIFLSSILAFTNNLDNVRKLEGNPRNSLFGKIYNYGNSKLSLVIISNEFARKLKSYRITSNAIHPGYALTEIFDGLKTGPIWHYPFIVGVVIATTMTIVDAAQTSLIVAISNKYKTATGNFLGVWGLSPPRVKNQKLCREVFEYLEGITQLRPHEKI